MYIPLINIACDIDFMRNVESYLSAGWSSDMAIRLAEEDERRVIDSIEREEVAAANEE